MIKKYIILGGLSGLLLTGCFSGAGHQASYPSINKHPTHAVGEFIANYGRHGEGPLYMHVPSTIAGGRGVQEAQALIRQNMNRYGVPQSQVSIANYQPYNGGASPVVVSYKRLQAELRDCRSLGDLTRTSGNMPYAEFGCSANSNLAAMIENPNQFLAPYPMGPPNAERRKDVYDKYIAGENPASEQPDRQEISSTQATGGGGGS